MVSALIDEGGYLCSETEKTALRAAMWDENGNRTFPTIACPCSRRPRSPVLRPRSRQVLMVENSGQIGPEHKF